MAETTDVLIAGGGAIGSAIAYFLAASPDFDGKIIVAEKDPTYARASSPLSMGGIRQQFSISENMQIGFFAREFIRDVGQYLTVEGEPPELGFVEGGYMFMADAANRSVLEENHAAQIAEGVDVELLSPDALAAEFPWINPDGLELACISRSGEGWLDPNALMMGFRRKARSLGVEYIASEVTDIERKGGTIRAGILDGERRIECGTFVSAAGRLSGRLMAKIDVKVPVEPRKRMIYVIHCRQEIAPRAPLTIDTNGVFFRPEGVNFCCGTSPPEDQDPDAGDDFELDYSWFEEVVWPTIANRVPAFEEIKLTSAWCGHYDHNVTDHNAIIGGHPEIGNLFMATGFSGHGLQQSPAVGRAIMELITKGAYQSIDLTRFGYERILEGRLLKERNIV